MMKKRLSICALIAVFTLSACATTGVNYRPIVDTKNVDMNKFEADLGECRQYAAQTAGAAERAAAGAAAGAIFGALLAAAAGVRNDRSAVARVGALSGAVSGAAEGETDQRNIIRRCLAGRGYMVLQ